MPFFQTEVQKIPGMKNVLKLVVLGRVTVRDAPTFREIILTAIDNAEGTALVIELAGVDHIDTAGIAVLVEGILAGQKRSLKVLLCQPNESVLQIFRLLKLKDALEASCAMPGELEKMLMR